MDRAQSVSTLLRRRLGLQRVQTLLVIFTIASATHLSGTEVYIQGVGNGRNCLITVPGVVGGMVTCTSDHHFVPGDLVEVANVPGNKTANGLRRVGSVPTANTFTITDVNGSAIADSGLWLQGDAPPDGGGWIGGLQIVGKVAPHALRDHPRILLNPAGNLIHFAASVRNGLLRSITVEGNIATAVYSRNHGLVPGQTICVFAASDSRLNCANPSAFFIIIASPSATTLQFSVQNVAPGAYNSNDLTISAWAQGDNPAWVAVSSVRSFLEDVYQLPGTDTSRDRSLNFALLCYVNRLDATACSVAKWAITHTEDMANNFGLDETMNYGGDAGVDYISFRLFNTALIYTLTRDLLTPAERETFSSKILNDLADPVLGGDCQKTLRTDRTGTITKAGDYFSPVAITGAGTNFLTDLHVGAVLGPPSGSPVYENYFVFITAIADNTHATGVGVAWTGHYSEIAPWHRTACGAIWFSKHHPAGPLSHPLLYPRNGGTTIYGTGALSNISITKTWAHLAIGLALADDDPRARQLVTDSSMFFINYTWPLVRNFWTGFSGSGSNYHYARVSYMVPDIIAMLDNSLQNMPDMKGGTYLKNLGAHLRYLWAPDNGQDQRKGIWAWGADGSTAILDWSGGRPFALGAAMSLNPTDPDIQKTQFWLRRVFNTFDAPTIGENKGYYSAGVFLRTPPTLAESDYRRGPKQRVFRGTDRSVCLAQSSVPCPSNGGFDMVVSRTGWANPNDTVVGYDAADFFSDHSVQRAGDYVIYKNGLLVGGDSAGASAQAGAPEFHRSNLYQIEGVRVNRGEVSNNYGKIVMEPYNSEISRWAGGNDDDGRTDSALAYWLNDLTHTFNGNSIKRFHRHTTHLKRPGAGEYLVLYDDVSITPGSAIRFFTHYQNNGQQNEGVTTCAGGCTNLQVNREVSTWSTMNGVSTRFVPVPGVPSHVYLDRSDGTFPGGLGHSFRVSSCAGISPACSSSATSYEMLTVHKIFAGSPSPITLTQINPTELWTGLDLGDYVVMYARNGALLASVPAITHPGSPFVASSIAVGYSPLPESGAISRGPLLNRAKSQFSYFVAGLRPGIYRFSRNGEPVDGCEAVVVSVSDHTAFCPTVLGGTITVEPFNQEQKVAKGLVRF